MSTQESSAPKASEPDSGDKTGTAIDTDVTTGEKRKANFFERKRFVDYE